LLTVDHWLSRLPRRDWLGWSLCLAVIVLAGVLRLFFPLAGAFITFYPAILFCSLVGGMRAGLLALAAGLLLAPFAFAREGVTILSLWPALSWLSFALFGYAIVLAIDLQQRTLQKSRQLTEQFRRQQHFTDHVISAAPSLTYIYDTASNTNVFVSPQVEDILGYTMDEITHMGSGVLARLVHPDDAPRARRRFEALRVDAGAIEPEFEYRMRRKDGSWVWLLTSERVFTRDRNGTPLQILGVATDITARKHFEEQLLASEERFRGIFENAPTGISISGIDGNFVQCNPAYEKILGYRLEELRNASFSMLVHPDDRAANLAEMERLVRREIPYFEIFNRSIHKNGRVVWVHKFVLMLKDREGRSANIVALLTDMTERKRQEEQIRLLMREVNHRSKNLLAVVQSVARQTAIHGDPQSFAQRFSERLQGLAASHDLLVHNSWQGVGLEELVHSQLSHFKDLVGGRISLAGPAVRINATAAQSVGMALHELSVNAGKYGALSNRSGTVSIRWAVEDMPDGKRFSLEWRETGGPPVAVPGHSGLGSVILTRLVEQSLGGEVKLDLAAEGLSWSLVAPLSTVAESGLFAPL
jgi:PAS domain S-box-containing protein